MTRPITRQARRANLLKQLKALIGVDLHRLASDQGLIAFAEQLSADFAHQAILQALGINAAGYHIRTIQARDSASDLHAARALALTTIAKDQAQLPLEQSALAVELSGLLLIAHAVPENGSHASRILTAAHFDLASHPQVYAQVRADYEAIAGQLAAGRPPKRAMGDLVQAHSTLTGACFYARRELLDIALAGDLSGLPAPQDVPQETEAFGMSGRLAAELDRRRAANSRPPLTETEARQRLEAFLADPAYNTGRRWPSRQAFQAAGLLDFYWDIQRFKPIQDWAAEFGYGYTGTGRLWSDQRIEQALAGVCAGRLDWPTEREFDEAGLANLYNAVQRYGGIAYWAERLGLLARSGGGSRSYWTDENIDGMLGVLLAGRDRFPSPAEFRAAGLVSLLHACQRRGLDWWAERVGLAKNAWPDARIAKELRALMAGRDSWPTQDELYAAGLGGLATAISRSEGGNARWARQFGFAAPKHGPRIASDEEIRAELAPFLNGREAWPTTAEFREAGKSKLLYALRSHGGPQRWAREFRLAYKQGSSRWSDERILAESAKLLHLTGGRRPSFSEASGLGFDRLWEAMRYRGHAYWFERALQEAPALEAGADLTPWTPRARRSRTWDDRYILSELAAVCRDCGHPQPTRAEAVAHCGKRADRLWMAMYRRGGPHRFFALLAPVELAQAA